MSEANIGLTLPSKDRRRDTTDVESEVAQPRIHQEDPANIDRDVPEANAHRSSPQEIAQTIAPDTWENALYHLGTKFLQLRQDRGMSLYQLHAQTFVPLHILKALESGNLTQLPERVYVEGFIRRIGDALGLDGGKLVALLPADHLPSGSSEVRKWKLNLFYLNRFHLYLGYIVLLIAAIASLSWILNPPPQESSVEKASDRVVESDTSKPQIPINTTK